MTTEQEFMTAATGQMAKAKAKLQEETHVKRVQDLADEARSRLESLVSKAYSVTSDVRKVEDGDTSHYKSYPAGAFGSTATDLDALLATLAEECERLESHRQASAEAERLSRELGGMAKAAGLFDAESTPLSESATSVPESNGLYL